MYFSMCAGTSMLFRAVGSSSLKSGMPAASLYPKSGRDMRPRLITGVLAVSDEAAPPALPAVSGEARPAAGVLADARGGLFSRSHGAGVSGCSVALLAASSAQTIAGTKTVWSELLSSSRDSGCPATTTMASSTSGVSSTFVPMILPDVLPRGLWACFGIILPAVPLVCESPPHRLRSVTPATMPTAATSAIERGTAINADLDSVFALLSANACNSAVVTNVVAVGAGVEVRVVGRSVVAELAAIGLLLRVLTKEGVALIGIVLGAGVATVLGAGVATVLGAGVVLVLVLVLVVVVVVDAAVVSESNSGASVVVLKLWACIIIGATPPLASSSLACAVSKRRNAKRIRPFMILSQAGTCKRLCANAVGVQGGERCSKTPTSR